MSASESIATPGPPHLARSARVVGVEPELRRQVERDREPRLALREQVAVALVRLLGRREARVLADRPRPAAVHVAVDAARERRRARRLELARRVGRPVDRLDLDARLVHERRRRVVATPNRYNVPAKHGEHGNDLEDAPDRGRASLCRRLLIGLVALVVAIVFSRAASWYTTFLADPYPRRRVWIGGGLLLTVFGLLAAAGPGRGQLAQIARMAAFAGERIFAPAAIVVAAHGHRDGASTPLGLRPLLAHLRPARLPDHLRARHRRARPDVEAGAAMVAEKGPDRSRRCRPTPRRSSCSPAPTSRCSSS